MGNATERSGAQGPATGVRATANGAPGMGARRFGRVNWLGLYTLIEREVIRFTTIWTQTIMAPLITAGLFLLVFSLALGSRRGDVMGVPFASFLAPGILMMTVIQNAFANTASSLVISKIQGNIVDTLMPPLSPAELVIGYVAGGVLRGFAVAAAVMIVTFPVLGVGIAHPLWVVLFITMGSALLALVGMLAGIVSERFDQMNAITNFIITPLSFLSGTFYSIEVLPDFLRVLTHFNPVFYLIDGLRYGVIGASDSSPVVGALFCGALIVVLGLWTWRWFASGYRLKA